MSQILKNKLILPTNWMITAKHYLDREYQSYLLKAAKQKFEEKIKSSEFDNMYEIIFHMLNMNTLTADHILYDETFNKQKSGERLDVFINMFKKFETSKLRAGSINFTNNTNEEIVENNVGTENMTVANYILEDARKLFFNIFKKYMNEAIRVSGGIDIITKNDHIHLNKFIYVVINVVGHDIFDLWRISFNLDYQLGSTINHAGTFNISAKNGLPKMVEEFNKGEKEFPLHERNTMIASLEKAHDHKQIAYLIKDIIQLNKLFVGNAPIVNDIIMGIANKAEHDKHFSFKLIMENK